MGLLQLFIISVYYVSFHLLLSIPLLLLLLRTSNVVRFPSVEGGDEWGGTWGRVRLRIDITVFGTTIVLHIPFRMFAYSSNILKAN